MILRAAVATFAIATAASAEPVSDTTALAIVHNHCVMCHAAKPTHESVQEPPKNVTLETIADLKKHAATIYAQTVQTKAMPLGNQTTMTDDERAALGAWLKGLP